MISLWLWAIVPVLLAVCHVLYNIFLHPLRKFPGPVLAGATSYWKAWKEVVLQETMAQELFGLHEKYGRMAPLEILMVYQSLSDTLRRGNCSHRPKRGGVSLAVSHHEFGY